MACQATTGDCVAWIKSTPLLLCLQGRTEGPQSVGSSDILSIPHREIIANSRIIVLFF